MHGMELLQPEEIEFEATKSYNDIFVSEVLL